MTLLNHLHGGEHIANVDPHFERVYKYQKRAWLSITPAKMITLCQELDVSTAAGCSVELRIYQQDASVLDYGCSTYDVAFGLVRRK